MNGILLVDKAAGVTSHDVVARVRRVLSVKRIGHAGTLDPPATGLLVLGIGRATRLLRFLEVHDKSYTADVVFGATTTTQDATGDLVAERDASTLTAEAVKAALGAFRGTIEQIPPMVSAVKVGGERLYKKARRGEEVERAPRAITIHTLTMTSFESGRAQLQVRCSKGTYIRTLAADIGESVGVGAHLAALRRTAIGPFEVADAAAMDEVGPAGVRPMEDALAGYPRRDVDADGVRALIHGKVLPAAGIDGPYGVWGPDGLVAVCEDRGEGARSLCVVTTG